MSPLPIRPHTVAVQDVGDGPPIVLIHGFPGNAADWAHVATRLSPHHRVLIPDLLGFGRSDKPAGFNDLWVDAQAAAIAASLAQHGVTREVTLVGHDYGGPVAVTIAARYPGLVSGLVLSACNVFRDPELQLPMRLLPTPVLGSLIESVLFSAFAIRMMGATGTRSRHATPTGNTANEVRAIRTIFATALRALDQSFGPVQDSFQQLAIPVLVAWGDRDPFFSVRHARRVAAALPQTTLQLFPNVGHFPQLEVAEAYVAAIRTHVERQKEVCA